MLIVLLTPSGLGIIGSFFVQSIPKSSVLEFTIEFDYSFYDVPTT
jgi:hypothetical protein